MSITGTITLWEAIMSITGTIASTHNLITATYNTITIN